ncbi:MAG: OmpA family protein [Prevotella sp.]|uniref:OmpA family protein n=1 Tax=Prevotella sp. TaxID=59823 RepID=UPI002A2FB0EF|nr:OmpA family protein [Prevotella sp.]MDD7318112.1 OmpA family protein [Prevotellaceae bacterium]MDY4020999.1 OmpA family protein [Prevotella sp.]
MKKFKLMTLLMCLAVLVSCNNTGKGALIGTGGGALLGAVVGKLAGNTAVGATVGAAVGAGAGALIGKKMDKAAERAQAIDNAKVEEITDANGLKAVKVSFDSGILFSSGKSDLQPSAKAALSDFAGVLKEFADTDVAIQGYTDNQGWRGSSATQSYEKNKQLSLQRAQSVLNYLTSQGVKYSQIKSCEGFGEENPVASNNTAAGQAQNRRVEVYMYASEAMINAANNGNLR